MVGLGSPGFAWDSGVDGLCSACISPVSIWPQGGFGGKLRGTLLLPKGGWGGGSSWGICRWPGGLSEIGEVAARQRGLITRAQLTVLGLGRNEPEPDRVPRRLGL